MLHRPVEVAGLIRHYFYFVINSASCCSARTRTAGNPLRKWNLCHVRPQHRVRRCSLRTLPFIIALALSVAVPAQPQQKQARGNPVPTCRPQKLDLPYYYVEAVLEGIEPPNWRHSLIRIAVGTGVKVDLWTDGETFKLWTTTVRYRDVEKILANLDQSCRLPAESHYADKPDAAAALIKVKWESVDLTSAQFAQIHQEFTNALLQYVSGAQARYAPMIETKMGVIYLDSDGFRIVYDNDYEHVETYVWDDPNQEQNLPLLKWISGLQRLAEDSFHHPVGPKISQ
jgi:hypothetical protein